MQNSNILIVGQGFLGQQIADYFKTRANVATIDFPDVDITSEPSLMKVFEHHKPDIVINAAAFADTHAAEKPENHARVFDINVRGPVNLMMLAKPFNYRLVHIGTGMIYDGKPPFSDGFMETDTPNPSSYYAWTKACADASLAPFCDTHRILITRIHLPISAKQSPKNLLTKMTAFDTFATDAGSITMVDDYLAILDQLINQEACGVFHIANSGTVSFYQIAEILQKHGLISRDKSLNTITIETLNRQIKEKGGALQTKTHLSTKKLAKHGIVVRDIHTALEECVGRYKKELEGEHAI